MFLVTVVHLDAPDVPARRLADGAAQNVAQVGLLAGATSVVEVAGRPAGFASGADGGHAARSWFFQARGRLLSVLAVRTDEGADSTGAEKVDAALASMPLVEPRPPSGGTDTSGRAETSQRPETSGRAPRGPALSLLPHAGWLADRSSRSPPSDRVVELANPSGNLDGAEAEGRLVARRFDNTHTFIDEGVAVPELLEAVDGSGLFHFAGHDEVMGRIPHATLFRVGPNEVLTLEDWLAARPRRPLRGQRLRDARARPPRRRRPPPVPPRHRDPRRARPPRPPPRRRSARLHAGLLRGRGR